MLRRQQRGVEAAAAKNSHYQALHFRNDAFGPRATALQPPHASGWVWGSSGAAEAAHVQPVDVLFELLQRPPENG